ncbi:MULTISPECIES: DUF2357 domain-containing protein [unclassified Pseudomonas]|uniref:DUF2357 domain-containing protein n=1 Tax=unclassified Pseudomonas TaxID=196821 RepID=UPI001CBF25EC|nr:MULTISPECIES: DUF2357 domain-containing protein [unclassified Pseudomonas]
MANSADLEFKNIAGDVLGYISIFAPSNVVDGIVEVSSVEAEQYFEEATQIYEATQYEYQLLSHISGCTVRTACGVVGLKASQIPTLVGCGVIDTGSYVGRLELELISAAGDLLSSVALEVRSRKIGYRNDFREMAESIANHSIELLFDIRSPTTFKQTHVDDYSSSGCYQKILFLKGTLASKRFKDAVSFVISRPNEVLKKERVFRHIRQGVKPTSKSLREIASAVRRTGVADNHPIRGYVNSLPDALTYSSPVLSQDTPENQFVKFVLESFLSYLSTIDREISGLAGEQYSRISVDVKILVKELEAVLDNRLFARVSKMSSIPLSSQVLQRREGYREILNVWLRFDLAMQLSWSSGMDIFHAGQKNVALLYEYWVFFELVSLLKKFCSFGDEILLNVFEMSKDKLSLRLKQGRNISFKGSAVFGAASLSVRFDYNRSFPYTDLPSASGSWSRAMRPDYSLSFWPANESESESEANGAMVRLHFDAKYRVDAYEKIFSRDAFISENADDSGYEGEVKDDSSRKTYKRDDLLKMHAYRDAIKRSFGAYVLYPGSFNFNLQGYHEVLPGVGAFVMRPGMDSKYIFQFFNDLLGHLTSSTSRLNVAVYTAKIYH